MINTDAHYTHLDLMKKTLKNLMYNGEQMTLDQNETIPGWLSVERYKEVFYTNYEHGDHLQNLFSKSTLGGVFKFIGYRKKLKIQCYDVRPYFNLVEN